MQLDFNPSNSKFVLTAPRVEMPDPMIYVNEHGLDFSSTASTPNKAVLFTDVPYAAAPFAEWATPRAEAELADLLRKIELSRALDSNMHFDMPPDKELWAFQRADLEYGLTCKHWLDADQPGLGKTPTAIVFANTIQARRVLVIVPASLRLQWVKRIREWMTTDWRTTIHPILSAAKGVHPNAQWTIVSYELAANPHIGAALAKLKYDLLIMDEAHYAKSIDARRTRAIFGGGKNPAFEPLAERAEITMALTGTPLPNRPREAYTLCRNLCWDSIDWMSEEDFTDRFNPKRTWRGADGQVFAEERVGREHELQARLRGNFMARHLKREVMPQLKMPVFDLVQAEETGAVRQALKAESLLDIDPEDLEGADAKTLGHVSVVRRMMGLALAPQVADYVDTIMDGGEDKLVVFGHHKEVLDIWETRFRHYGVVRVDGSTGAARKEQRVSTFINQRSCRVIIGNILSLGTGTDGLQSVAWHAIIGEPDWVPGNNQQAFDRLDRGGQTRTVLGEIFVAPGSFAEKILASALRKLQTVDKTLDRRIKL